MMRKNIRETWREGRSRKKKIEEWDNLQTHQP